MLLIIAFPSNKAGIQVQNLIILTITLHYHLDYYRGFNRMEITTSGDICDGYLKIS